MIFVYSSWQLLTWSQHLRNTIFHKNLEDYLFEKNKDRARSSLLPMMQPDLSEPAYTCLEPITETIEECMKSMQIQTLSLTLF